MKAVTRPLITPMRAPTRHSRPAALTDEDLREEVFCIDVPLFSSDATTLLGIVLIGAYLSVHTGASIASEGRVAPIHRESEKESSRKLISSPPNSYALGSELSAVRPSIGIVVNTICSGGA